MILEPKNLEGMSREGLVEEIIISERENSRLRAIILEMAGRPEITVETRRWLAETIRDPSKTLIVNERVEDEREEYLRLLRVVEKLVDHVQLLDSFAENEHPKADWYEKADALANQAAGFVGDEMPRTFVELKAGK